MAISKINTPEIFDLGATNTSLKLPSGGTDSRPSNPSAGQWRYNTDLKYVEYYDGNDWQQIDIEEDCTTDTVNFPSGATLAAYYKLDYTARDESTNNYDGTQVDVSYVNGSPYSQAAVFNGSSSYINLPLNIASLFFGKNTLAVSFWFKTTTTERQRMFTDYAQNSRNIDITMDGTTGGTVEVVTMYSSSSITFDSTASYNDGNWHHIVVALDQSSLTRTIYIDNVLLNTATFSSNSWNGTSGARVTLGGFYSSSGGYTSNLFFDGQIDQLRVFTSAITNTQVSELYNEVQCPCTTNTIGYSVDAIGSTTNTSTEAYYKLDGNAYDATANANNGTWTTAGTGAEDYAVGPYGVGAFFNPSGGANGESIDTGFKPPTGSSDFSISCWINCDDVGEARGICGTFTNDSITDRKGFNINVSTGQVLQVIAFDSAGAGTINANNPSTLTLNRWYHVVMTYDGGTIKFYIDGLLQTATMSQSITAHETNLFIGRYYGTIDYVNLFSGTIDQFKVFYSALDQTQVTALSNEVYCNTLSTLDVFGDSTGVALYQLNGNADSTDSSSNNGTWTGTEAYAGGYFDRAADFDGSSSLDTNYDLPATTGTFSISCWFKRDQLGRLDGIYSTNKQGGDDRFGLGLHILTSNVMRVVVFDSVGGAALNCTNPSTIPVDTWFHVVVTYDGGLTKMYVNGNLQPSTINQVITSHHSSLFLARYEANQTTNTLLGDIDQVRIFTKVLTAFEVLQLYSE